MGKKGALTEPIGNLKTKRGIPDFYRLQMPFRAVANALSCGRKCLFVWSLDKGRCPGEVT